MQKILGPSLGLVFIAACGSAAVKDGSNSVNKTPTSAQAAQVSALFAGQMTNAASSQGSSNQSAKAVQRDAATDPNCAAGGQQAASDPNCSGDFGGDGPGLGGSQTISIAAFTVPCESGGNVVQSGNMTFSESFGAGDTFAMSGSMALEAIYHACAMPAPDGNVYTMNAPGGVAQDMNMTMTFSGFDPNNADPSSPSFPQMTMTSTVVGEGITVYAADGSVVGAGSVDLSMAITLDPNGGGYVHFSGTQFGLAVDANQTFTPPSTN